MDWDLSTWGLVMMSLSTMQPKSDFPGSANQRATRLTPSFVTHQPPLTPRTRKMASYTSRTDSSVWLIIRSSPLYSEGSSILPELPKKFSIMSRQIRFQTKRFQTLLQRKCAIKAVLAYVFSQCRALQGAKKFSYAVNIQIWKKLSWCIKHVILFTETQLNPSIILIN